MIRSSGTLIVILLLATMSACSDVTATDVPPSQPPEQFMQTTSSSSTQHTLSSEQLTEFADFIEQARQVNNIPGVAAIVVRDDQAVLVEGFGVRDIRGVEPVTPETLFHIGSTHKSMTAMLIASLVDDGLFEWDTPVAMIHPDFALSDPGATEQVTMRHLLSMSSGISAETEELLDVEVDQAADIFDVLGDVPLAGSPGEQFRYSNVSVAAAGYVGVLATGGEIDELYEGYARLLQTRILDPIGMDTATLSVEEARTNPNRATSHVFDAAAGDVIVAESYDVTGDPIAPAGAIKASGLDMAQYLLTQVRRGVAPDDTRIVSEQNLTETWRPQIEDTDAGGSYGMGWGIETQSGVEVIAHEGSYDNFSAMIVLVPETNSGMALLTNIDDPGDFLETVREQFVELLVE